MKTAGLVTEYNPFHNGHKYHIEKAREITGADHIIVIMSGDFVQRGSCAVTDKYTRAAMALSEGASLVLELPVCFATGSAEFFARGAVRLLHQSGVTDTLCFGCEHAELSVFERVTALLLEESAAYRQVLKHALSEGCSYPAARQKALTACMPDLKPDGFLQSPNNILGLEYVKALRLERSSITPVPIQRTGNNYHDTTLGSTFSSATAIRREISAHHVSAGAQKHIPQNAVTILNNQLHSRGSLRIDHFSALLKYALMTENASSLCRYQDMTGPLANRIPKHLNQFMDFSSFISLLKTRELTHSRISRALLHVMLKLTDDLLTQALQPESGYLRILGFRKDAGELLKKLKRKSAIPVITKLADKDKILNSSASGVLDHDIFAAHLYESVITDTYHTPFQNEYTRTPVIF